jgi:hypothetical protein
MFKKMVAPSTAVVPPKAEPAKDAEAAPSSTEGISQAVEQS